MKNLHIIYNNYQNQPKLSKSTFNSKLLWVCRIHHLNSLLYFAPLCSLSFPLRLKWSSVVVDKAVTLPLQFFSADPEVYILTTQWEAHWYLILGREQLEHQVVQWWVQTLSHTGWDILTGCWLASLASLQLSKCWLGTPQQYNQVLLG